MFVFVIINITNIFETTKFILLENIYLKHTLIAPEKIHSLFDRDTFFDVQQAEKWGLIDHCAFNTEKDPLSPLVVA